MRSIKIFRFIVLSMVISVYGVESVNNQMFTGKLENSWKECYTWGICWNISPGWGSKRDADKGKRVFVALEKLSWRRERICIGK